MRTMASATKTLKGFKVLCPECGDQEAIVRMDLNDLKACTCSSCDAEFSPADAVAKATEQLRRWQAVARWVEIAGECLAE
jgi:uncharacterized protein (DUF983 family)